jgi:glucokinase
MESVTRHLGLDLGATNLKWVVVQHAAGAWTVIDDGQVRTDVAGGPPGIVAQLVALARETVERHGGRARDDGGGAGDAVGISSIGVGVPGLYDPAHGRAVFLTNLPGEWDHVPVAEPITAETGIPTALINDARAFGLAELRLGAGRGTRTMAGFTLGTGIGGVICVHGEVIQGRMGGAGELGHQTIDPDGPWCTCGNRGCLESYARADQIARLCGTSTPEEAVRAARSGDARAIWGLSEVGRYLGIGIANAIVMLTPDRVILGGGISAAGEVLIGPIRDEVRRRVFTTSPDAVEIVTAELGTLAGAIGAAIHGAEQAAVAERAALERAAGP